MKNPSQDLPLPLIQSGCCLGEGCESMEPWPVHQIRHRNNIFLRLCTSCVLKYHPGSFCSSCFQVFESGDRPPHLLHCSKCPSVVHQSCLLDPSMDSIYICPPCDSPSPNSFSYFPFSKISSHRSIDLHAAKILLAAAQLSASSMTRAANIARSDAEKKVKEAAFAKKRAREMIERSIVVFEKKNVEDKIRTSVVPVIEVVEQKKKVVQKRVQEREREKWKRFSEPIGLVNKSAVLVVADEKMKGRFSSDLMDVGVRDDEKKGIVSASMNEIVKQQ